MILSATMALLQSYIPSVAYSSTLTTTSEVIILYLYILGYASFTIISIDLLQDSSLLSDFTLPSPSHTRLRKGKKHRSRRLPFFRRRHFKFKSQSHPNPLYDEHGFSYLTPDEVDARDWKDLKPSILHQCNFSHNFMHTCSIMPDFILLFTHEKDICTVHRQPASTQQFIFHSSDSTGVLQAFDVTELTQSSTTNHLL